MKRFIFARHLAGVFSLVPLIINAQQTPAAQRPDSPSSIRSMASATRRLDASSSRILALMSQGVYFRQN
jgi:hypothetical protein